MVNRFSWRQASLWGLVVLLSLIPLGVAWHIRHSLSYDDAYVTLTYARNIALGKGFVYNAGPPYLGTTSPLLALILGGMGALFHYFDIPVLALLVGCFSWAGAVILSFMLGRRILGAAAGVFMAVLLATMPVYPHLLRAEFPLLIFFSLLALLLTIEQRYWLAGVIFALAFLTRGDSALLAGLTGLAVIWQRRRVPWGLGFGFILALIPWFVYASFTFGNPLPATLGVKQAHRALGAWPHIARGFLNWLGRSKLAFRAWFILTLVFALMGLPWFFLKKNVWATLIVAWGMVYVGAYLLLNVPFYFWYAAPLLVSTLLSSGLTAGAMWGRFERRIAGSGSAPARDGMATVAAGVVALFLAVALFTAIPSWQSRLMLHPDEAKPRYEAYLRTADWLRQNTPEDSTAAYIEVGLIGYYSQRQILDLLGLVTPGAEDYITSRNLAGLFEKWRSDYYIRNRDIDNWGMNAQVYNSPFFQANYTPVTTIPQRNAKPIVIYKRNEAR